MEVKFGVDEMTIVVKIPKKSNDVLLFSTWDEIAHEYIDEIETKLNLINILGEKGIQDKNPKGYNCAYMYGNHSFYFAIAFHKDYPNMGLCIKFSAKALNYYINKSDIKPYEIIKIIQSDDYECRLSRIDFTADYFDYDIDLNELYKDLNSEKVLIFMEKYNAETDKISYQLSTKKFESHMSNNTIETIYCGSRKANINSLLRIYDKKREQINTKGIFLDCAKKCNSWIRFEVVFRGIYSHQITEQLLKIDSDSEFVNLICSNIFRKYQFWNTSDGKKRDTLLDFSDILKSSTNNVSRLRTTTNRNYELITYINYICDGSGLFSLFFKIENVFSKKDLNYFIEFLFEKYKEYVPNNDCYNWINNRKEEYKDIRLIDILEES